MEIRTGTIQVPIGTWTAMIGDDFGVITADMTLVHQLPRRDLGFLVHVRTPFRRPQSNGMPDRDEAYEIHIMEEELEREFSRHGLTAFAGHIYCAGKYEGYFYVSSAKVLQAAVKNVATLPNIPPYHLEFLLQEDPEWSVYRKHLYPNPMGIASILTAQVVQSLEKDGDDLTRPRAVHHHLAFATGDQAERFLQRIQPENFKLDSRSEDTGKSLPVLLTISRVDSVQLKEIDDTVSWVFLQATECGGKYEGWVTQILGKPTA